ncbi:MAG TPA: NADH:flavin oxidoreductase [Acidimicrobiaceae bacterium]|nr:NADH:flavin oxidoreductase [Acidimicrobiaceae bacterium]
MSDSTVDAFAPAQLGPITLRNRIIKSATFEGMMPKGAVTPELINFHRQLAAGGVGLTTVAYCAISMGGRVNANSLVFREELIADLLPLTEAVHGEGGKISAQIGHAGLVAQAQSKKYPSMAPTARFSAPAMGWVKAATPRQLDEVAAEFQRAARVAIAAGFDAIEVHLGHNYLLSSFLSPNLNKRTDEFGGSIENRSRFPRRVLEAVREVIGDQPVALLAKFNMADGVDKGLWLEDSLAVAKLIEADGHIDALELTGGSSVLNGMYFFRGDVPMREFAATQKPFIRPGFMLFGSKIFPKYPYEELFFLPFARQFRAALDMPLVLLGGINDRASIETAMDEGFEFVAMARALLREPDLIAHYASGSRNSGLCVHCNKCLPTIYSGTHCVLVTPT